MKKIIIVIFFALGMVQGAFAATDYKCVKKCIDLGQPYDLCKFRCTYAGNIGQPPSDTNAIVTDFECLKTCTGEGKAYNQCKSSCVYLGEMSQVSNESVKIDKACLKDCMDKGKSYGQCRTKCIIIPTDLNDPRVPASIRNPMTACVNQCVQKGRQYDFCKTECTGKEGYMPEESFSPLDRIPQGDYCFEMCVQGGYVHDYCRKHCGVYDEQEAPETQATLDLPEDE